MIAPALVEIVNSMPALKVEVCSTYDLQHVEARQADIALRVLRAEPEYPLVGRKLKKLAGAVYTTVSKRAEKPVFVVRENEVDTPEAYRVWDRDSPTIHTDEIISKLELIAAGGVGRLPVFMGDADPRLKRLTGLLPDAGWCLWLVTHDAFRSSPRLDYAIKAITTHFNKHV
jgi:DNA-binding transcriptional LysR family regulator